MLTTLKDVVLKRSGAWEPPKGVLAPPRISFGRDLCLQTHDYRDPQARKTEIGISASKLTTTASRKAEKPGGEAG